MLSEQSLRIVAGRYVGVPFLDHGRSPDTGWDCWGLLRHVGREIGWGAQPEFGECYSRADDADRVSAAIDLYLGSWQRLNRPAPGTGLLFRRRDGQAFHVGLALNRREMLHAASGVTGGTAIEPFDTLVWARRLDGAYLPINMGKERG